MNNLYEEIKAKAASAFRALSKECVQFDDARMLLGAADSTTSLTRSKISKVVDTDWIDKIEAALPSIDVIIRNPSVTIEDVDEILPVELSKHITDKSIKHLAQHTNLILEVKGDEIVPQKILNVFHEETSLTYENKFVNTLLSRLSAFVDKRLRVLNGTSGTEVNYKFGYTTEFEHFASKDGGRNSARVDLRIELTSPLGSQITESDLEINERYIEALNRIKRINMALVGYGSSAFAQKLGKNYVRPPIIRTNAILKNKDLKECLNLWEYIESYEKVGYSFVGDKLYELPSADFVSGMYSSAALQYLALYSGVTEENESSRLISEKHLFETLPEFDDEIENEEIDDYQVYDSEYRKTVPVSRLMNNRKKLSEDERKIRRAILVALKADEIINEEILREEAEKRRLAREKRLAEEEEARRLREEAEAERLREEERRLAEEAKTREVAVRYRRSFMSRYIQAESYIQDYYTEIKNLLLSYKGVKAKTAWSKENFKRGRIHIAKIDVKGKMLCLYLAIDPKTLIGTKYNVSEVKGECPTLIKVKSERKKKYALELITKLMESLGLVKIDREFEDYRVAYEDNDALIERGLIKIILPKGEIIDENTVVVKSDLSELELKKRISTDVKEVQTDSDSFETVEESVLETEDLAEQINEEFENLEEQINEEFEDFAELVIEEVEDLVESANEETVELAEPVCKEVEDFEELSEEVQELPSEEQIISMVDEGVPEIEEIKDIVTYSVIERPTIHLTPSATPLVTRGERTASRPAYAFSGEGDVNPVLTIPYTRKQYLALPRKKKKKVLMNVNAILRYQATAQLLERLRALNSDNPRIIERMDLLEARLRIQRRFLPDAMLWADAVKRIIK